MERDAYRHMRESQFSHWWFRARRGVLVSLIEGLHLPAEARILEAGCGPGGNFRMLSRFGRVSSFDMDAETVAACVAEGMDCVQGRLPMDHPYHGSRRFDLVVALDVLEHVEQDEASLRSLASCLAPGGRLLVTVPAYQWMFSGHDRFHHHRRRYRLGKLTALAGSAGLEVERAGYYNTLLFPLIAAVRIAAKLAGGKPRNDADAPGRFANGLFERIFGYEARLLKFVRFPFGTSVFVIAAANRAAPPTAADA